MSSDSENELIMKDMISSNHQFMVELYQVLGEKEENVFFSPFSIYIALILAFLGSKGETAEELQTHLHLPRNREHLLTGLQNLLSELLDHPELSTATEMFVEQSYKLRASYKDDAKKFVNSESQLVDFKTASDNAAKIINSWVSSRTNNKINDLIPTGTLDDTTRLVLVNAVHFKDEWLNQFPKENTRKREFFTSADHSTEVEMMHVNDQHFNYREEETFKVLELPYKNENFKMVIFLPNEIDGLKALEKNLPELNVPDVLNGMRRVKVRVALPKFKLEKFIDLNEALNKLGINAMFDDRKADFTGIHEPTEQQLVVSKVLHKAFVDVSEEGTEAAAATDVEFVPYQCFVMESPKPYEFEVDHPFILGIFYDQINVFTGKICMI